MKINSALFFLVFSALLSCNQYSRTDYPQSVNSSPNYLHINSYHQLEVENLEIIPQHIQNKMTQLLKNRLGEERFSKLTYKSTDIWSDKPIPRGPAKSLTEVLLYGDDTLTRVSGEGIDSIYNYPLYANNYQFSLPEKGIDTLHMNLILDVDGDIIKDIAYPKNGFENFIPIDSIHSELIRRKIPSDKLKIYLSYSEKTNSYIWSTSSLIRSGSIFGSSCFPEIEQHFKMNAFTGVITEFNSENYEEYFDELY